METYIVKNEKFEVKEAYLASLHSSIFYESHQDSQRYVLTNFNIVFTWNKERGQNFNDFQIIYKDVVLVSTKIANVQNIADYLNKFNTISKEVLNKLYDEAILNEKSALELEIETLKAIKKELEEKMVLFNQIGRKGKELSDLVEKLDT